MRPFGRLKIAAAGIAIVWPCLFLAFGFTCEAETAFTKSIDRRVFLKAEEHLKWGRQLRKAGDLELAIKEFEAAVRLNPMESRAWRELGLSSIDLGRVNRALEYLEEAIFVDPSDVPAYLARARVWLLVGLLDNAEVDAAKARALEGDNPAVLITFGDIFSSLGRHFEALEAYREAAELSPHPVTPLRRLGRLYFNLGMDRLAFDVYLQLKELAGLKAEDAECLARLHARLGGVPSPLVSAMNASPVSGEPYFDVGEWFLQVGDLDASSVFFFLALSRNALDFDAMMNLGYIAFAQEDYISAFKWFDAIKRKGVENDLLLYNLGLTSLKLQNNSLAAEFLEDAARIAPGRAEIYLLLAKTYHTLGLADCTLGAITEYLRLRPDAPDAADWLAYIEELKLELTE